MAHPTSRVTNNIVNIAKSSLTIYAINVNSLFAIKRRVNFVDFLTDNAIDVALLPETKLSFHKKCRCLILICSVQIDLIIAVVVAQQLLFTVISVCRLLPTPIDIKIKRLSIMWLKWNYLVQKLCSFLDIIQLDPRIPSFETLKTYSKILI